MNILTYHLHLALGMRREMLSNISNLLNLGLESQAIQEIMDALAEKETEAIQKYVNKKKAIKTDVIFLNSY